MTRKRTTLHSHSVKHLEDPKDRPLVINVSPHCLWTNPT